MILGAKYIAVSALLLGTLAVLDLRSDVDKVPPHQPLAQMPETIDSWTARDIPLDDEVLKVLGDGVFLNRVYEQPANAGSAAAPGGPVGLFIGYFPTQRTGQAIHSPQNCLPGAGWTFLSERPLHFTDARGRGFDVGEYVITNGNFKQEVLYWYQSHGRSIAGEYKAKFYLIADAMRYNRTDGALVRVITPFQIGETEEQAHNRALKFTKDMAPLLPAYIPD